MKKRLRQLIFNDISRSLSKKRRRFFWPFLPHGSRNFSEDPEAFSSFGRVPSSRGSILVSMWSMSCWRSIFVRRMLCCNWVKSILKLNSTFYLRTRYVQTYLFIQISYCRNKGTIYCRAAVLRIFYRKEQGGGWPCTKIRTFLGSNSAFFVCFVIYRDDYSVFMHRVVLDKI